MIKTDRNTQLPLIRVLTGIRNFGYTFESAVCDIIDNSIVAKAKEIKVTFEYNETQANQSVNRIIISDDGNGMSMDKMFNALFLGSPESEKEYEKNSLSKYGFGLKSAGLSLGDRIVLISREDKSQEWKKSLIDWNVFQSKNEYIVDEDVPIEDDEKKYLIAEKGTVVFICNLLEINKLNVIKIVKSIKKELGITFHRFIEDGISLYVNEDKVTPFDPLFCKELCGKFTDYDGRAPRSFWEEDNVIPVDSRTKAKAYVKAVVLPCPPLFEKEGRRGEIRNKYGITKQNVGFYIYRNKRLIKKGVTFGLIDRQNESFHIRIRIDFDSLSDNFINLDVKKTALYFDDAFMEKLKDRVNPFINRATELWVEVQKAGTDENQTGSEIKHKRSNKILHDLEPVECDPETLEVKHKKADLEKNVDQIKAEYPTDPNVLELIKARSKDRIIAVDTLKNQLLWEPNISDDGNSNVIVCLSRSHPFYSGIYQKLMPGSDAVVALDALFLCMAMSEMTISSVDTKKLSKLFKTLRQTVSSQLSNIIDLCIDSDEDATDGDDQ